MPSRWRYRDRVIISRPRHLRLVAVGMVALAASSLVACAPEADPTPTPTAAFASKEEAFAAAEEVYRAYNDAANARIAGEAAPDPQDFLTGLALEADIATLELFRENQVHLEGEGKIAEFRGDRAEINRADATVSAVVCLDASETLVVDSDGNNVTPTDRPEVSTLAVTFSGTRDRLLIAQSELAETQQC